MRMNLSKTSIELTLLEQDMLSHAINSALAGASFRVRRDGPAQPGTRNRRFDQTFRLRILGEFLHERPTPIPAFRNGDGVSLDTPPAIEHLRSRQFLDHLKQSRLVCRESVKL